MVEYVCGNIFDSRAQTLVNTVNCKGVMGKGLALEFKKRYPDMYDDYVKRCRAGEVNIGKPYLYRAKDRWILNFPTKDHWRRRSTLAYIEQGLRYFVAHYQEMGILSVAFPRLGTENGGLDWEQVQPIMERYLGNLEIDVEVYEYKPERRPKTSTAGEKAEQYRLPGF